MHHTVRARDVTPQSLRALQALIDSRGPEELRGLLEFVHDMLHDGHDVTAEADDATPLVVSVGLDGRSRPMWRYSDELHLPDALRSIVHPDHRPAAS